MTLTHLFKKGCSANCKDPFITLLTTECCALTFCKARMGRAITYKAQLSLTKVSILVWVIRYDEWVFARYMSCTHRESHRWQTRSRLPSTLQLLFVVHLMFKHLGFMKITNWMDYLFCNRDGWGVDMTVMKTVLSARLDIWPEERSKKWELKFD